MPFDRQMTLSNWRQHPLSERDLICGCSVDGVDELVDGLKNDPLIAEPIGAVVGFQIEHQRQWMRPTSGRDKLVNVAFKENTDARRRRQQPVNRRRIAQTLSRAGLPNRPLPRKRFWQDLGRAQFCVSPEGNGIDCHRTYEAIYLGAIPIVEDNPEIRKKLTGLPVLYTSDYHEITASYLRDKLSGLLDSHFDFSRVLKRCYPPAVQTLLNRRSHYWHHQQHKPPPPRIAHSSSTSTTVTVVTALADIGVDRDNHGPTRYRTRSMTTYREWMRPILAIDQPMVIFADSERADWIRHERRNAPATEVSVIEPTALAYYRRLAELIPQFSRDVKRPDRPEVNLPGYNALMFEKLPWVAAVAQRNPFSTGNFLWVDAGLGHGRLAQVTPGVNWPRWPHPRALKSWADDRIRLLALGKLNPITSGDWPRVLDSHENAIAGNCWGGNARAIAQAAELWPRIIDRTLDAGLLDDDQAIWRLLQSIYPALFQLESRRFFWGGIRRDWYHLVKRLGGRP